ncbi:MAG TPA: hypothetical protein PLC07_04620 [Bacillota bacterium]|nr:hypothetical protein [Bacillota bacterium]HPT86807.1 hypothetical protein [Bacillota bacterium]
MDWAKKIAASLKAEYLSTEEGTRRVIVEVGRDDFEPVIALVKARNGKVCHRLNSVHALVVEVDPRVIEELAQMKQVRMINADLKVAHCKEE